MRSRSPLRVLFIGSLLAASAFGSWSCRARGRRGAAGASHKVASSASSGPITAAAIAHGGVGGDERTSDGCRKAVDAALAALEKGADPIDAAVEGVVIMEDDPRFNAGTGSRVRIDGETVQMDASVMRSDGTFGAVAGIERVKNPVRVARAVIDTPHILLAGDGATRFARTLGMPDYDTATESMKLQAELLQVKLMTNDPTLPAAWKTFDWRKHWNFQRSLEEAGMVSPPDAPSGATSDAGHDTVGVAVRASDGRFGVALSTGGTSITLRGRVGDVPILGAGLFAGPFGASAATGVGERIVAVGLSRAVHDWLASGVSASDAAKRGVELVRAKGGDVGLIVITRDAMAAAADQEMPWAARTSGSETWSGPSPK